MSDTFNNFDEQLNSTLNKISNIILNMPNLSKEKTESAIKEANTLIQNAEQIIKQLEIEANSDNNRDRLMFKIKGQINELKKLKGEYFKLQQQYINAKSSEALYLNSDDVKDKNLIEGEELPDNDVKLTKGLNKMLEIEKNGHDIARQLYGHTNQMKQVNQNLDEMNDQLSDSTSIIGRMMRRENKNKLIVACAIILFVFILLIILSSKMSKDDKVDMTMSIPVIQDSQEKNVISLEPSSQVNKSKIDTTTSGKKRLI